MSNFKTVALIQVNNSMGCELDSVMAESTNEQDISIAMAELVRTAIFEVGDCIVISEIETEID
ncbi:hypothetical protein EBU24_02595 [bacterium]|nr:hypothetical protein [bacterium]